MLGSLPDLARTSAPLQVRLGLTLLGRIKNAFIVKAKGGTDEAGLRWKPLAPLTKKLRRGKPPYLILRDTGLLLNSLTPGAITPGASTPPVVPEQVFRLNPGVVTIGTVRPWAWAHHQGLPFRRPPLPQRRLWPEVSHWPSSWWLDLAEQAQQGIVDIVIDQVGKL